MLARNLGVVLETVLHKKKKYAWQNIEIIKFYNSILCEYI
jgi:hypothetical protein